MTWCFMLVYRHFFLHPMDGSKIFQYGTKYKGQTYETVAKDTKYVDSLHKRGPNPLFDDFLAYCAASRKVMNIDMSPVKEDEIKRTPVIRPLLPLTLTDWSHQLDPVPFEKIVHVSDTHIRLQSRIEEYDFVFEELVSSLNELKAKGTKAVIVVTGDILHQQDHLRPDCIMRTLHYFEQLACVFPTLIIAGNHDCCVANDQAADSLHAIFHEREPQGLFYARERGRYRLNNILFSVLSRVGSQRNMSIPWKADEQAQLQVALYHGPVEGACKADGTESHDQDRAFRKLSEFDGYDLVLLGDYHAYQHPGGNTHVAYAGSMICQNFGEVNHPHGYVLWDLSSKAATHVPLQNKYDHVLIDLDQESFAFSGKKLIGKLSEVASSLPPHGKFRLSYTTATDHGKVQDFKDALQKFCPSVSQDWRLAQTVVTDSVELCQGLELQVDKLSTVIKTFLLRHIGAIGLTQDRQDRLILEIDQLLQSQEILGATRSTADVELLEFKWSNILTYGENNVLNFRRLSKITSLTAPNSSGKSSMVDIILFSLFGDFKRGETTSMVNNNKRNMMTETTFKIGGDIYTIHRTARRNQRTGITEEHRVTFKKGQENLTGHNKKETESHIRKVLGTDENFMRLCICFQIPEEKPLWLLPPKERRTYLGNFHTIDLKVLDDAFKTKESELQSQIKSILDNLDRQSKTVTEKKHDELRVSLDEVMKEKAEKELEVERFLKEVNGIDRLLSGRPTAAVLKLLEEERSRLNELELLHQQNDKDALLHELESLTLIEREAEILEKHIQLRGNIATETEAAIDRDQEIAELLKKKQELHDADTTNRAKVDELQTHKHILTGKPHEAVVKFEKKKASVEQRLETMKKDYTLTGNLRYDDNCVCCVSNKEHLNILPGSIEIQALQVELSHTVKRLTEAQVLQHDFEKKELENREVDKAILSIKEQLYQDQLTLQEVDKLLNATKDNIQKQVEHRLTEGDEYEALCKQKKRAETVHKLLGMLDLLSQVRKAVEELEKEHSDCLQTDERRLKKEKLQGDAKRAQEAVRECYQRVGELKTALKAQQDRLREIEALNKDLAQLSGEHTIYKSLSGLTAHNGVLACHILGGHFLPELEGLVNRLLSTVLQRSVALRLKGKNGTDIEIDFIAPDGKRTSTLGGMESLMHDVAFRIALSQLALVPRYNFLIIDEGISVIDKERLANIDSLFEFFRAVFKHTIVVTHLEGITDHVDSHLTVEKNREGLSVLVSH